MSDAIQSDDEQGTVNSFASERPKLYTVAAIDLATFLSSWLAGAFLMASNYRRFGNFTAARTTLLIGVLGLVIFIFVDYMIVLPERFHPLAWLVGKVIRVGGIHIAARRLQGAAISNHEAAGGALFSPWRAVGISILLIPVALAILYLLAFLSGLELETIL